ncbi:hypothetical protein [Hymenobacter sp. B81]|uniref:hypothetical protein n=1 Tax=Hymenobacter sp. B81 TaxID=3344878 RepID=UPI0037DDE03A
MKAHRQLPLPVPAPPVARVVVFANAAAELWPEPKGVAGLYWRPGPRHLTDFQAAMEALLRLIRQQGTGKAFIDQRDMAPLTEQEQAWIVGHWLPRAVVQGHFHYAAAVQPREPAGRLIIAALQQQVPPEGPQYVTFDDEVEARQWLTRQVVIESRIAG